MTEKKLYTVTCSIEFQMPVLAEDALGALKLARSHVLDEVSNFMPADYDIMCVEGAKFTDDVWDSLCYGADGDETVNEAVARLGLETPAQAWAKRHGTDKDR